MLRRDSFFLLASGILALTGRGSLRGQEAKEPASKGQPDQKPARIEIDTLKKHVDDKKDLFFVDVREPKEIEELGSLKGYVNIPVGQIESRLSDIPKDRFIVTA
jgi:hypothetical protein